MVRLFVVGLGALCALWISAAPMPADLMGGTELDFAVTTKRAMELAAGTKDKAEIRLAPGGWVDGRFVLSEGQVGLVTLVIKGKSDHWDEFQEIEKTDRRLRAQKVPECRMTLELDFPVGVELVDVADGQVLKAEKTSTGTHYALAMSADFDMTFSRLKDEFNWWRSMGLLVSSSAKSGAELPGARAWMSWQGERFTNVETFDFAVMPRIAAVDRLKRFYLGCSTGGIYPNFSPDGWDRWTAMLTSFGLNAMQPDFRVEKRKARQIEILRRNGVELLTPIPAGCPVYNGFVIGEGEGRPESDRFVADPETLGKEPAHVRRELGRATCPSAVYERHPYFMEHTVKRMAETFAGYDGIWCNWEPFAFFGRGCFCDRCRGKFAAFAGISEAELLKEWPKVVARGGRLHRQFIRFTSAEHAKMMRVVAEEVEKICGGRDCKAGFIPGVAWCEMASMWRTSDYGKEVRPYDYAKGFKWISPWGPYAIYPTQEPYCRVGLADPHARLGITSFPPVTKETTAAYTLPWKGVIVPFRGGWWDAAQIYKPWALEQKWTKAARARKGGAQAARLRDICFWAWNRGGCDTVSKPLEKFAADSGLPCALHWDWWHRYPKDVGYPTYWPPYEGEGKFTATVRRLKDAGCYTMVYVNGMSRDRDDASWGADGEKDAQYEHDGTIHGHHWNPHTIEPHRLTTVCGEGAGFQRMIREVITTLHGAGLDAVYLDQVSCAAAKRCWSPHHRHSKGDVFGPLEGYHAYLQAARAENPGLALGSEEVSEAFLADFDLFISLFGTSYERCGLGTLPEFEAVPVWNALYHGLSAVFGSYLLVDGIPPWDDDRWPAERKWKPSDEKDWRSMFPDQFFVEFARTVAWGNQPTAHALKLEHVTDPKFAPEYRFMLEAAKFYAANLEFLFDGELRAPGRLTCAVKKVDFMRRGIYHPAGTYETAVQPALPVVFHNVWRAADGRAAAILVNWSDAEQPFALDCPDGKAEGVLPARSWRKVDLL